MHMSQKKSICAASSRWLCHSVNNIIHSFIQHRCRYGTNPPLILTCQDSYLHLLNARDSALAQNLCLNSYPSTGKTHVRIQSNATKIAFCKLTQWGMKLWWWVMWLVRRFVWTYRYSILLVGWGGAEGGVSLVVAGSKARLGLGEERTVLRWRGIWEVVLVLWVSVSGGWTWGWCFPRGYVGFCGKGRNVLLVLKLLQGSKACCRARLAWLLVRGGAAWPVKQP